MAIETFTMSQLTTPSRLHTGVQVAMGVISITSTVTASSIVYLTQVPDGCTILDWTFTIKQQAAVTAALNLQIGTSASQSCLGFFSFSSSATQADNLITGSHSPRGDRDLLPVKISLSDSIAGRPVWLTAKFSGLPSASDSAVILRFHVLYTSDGMIGHTTSR